jgi:hypothetical protein
MCGRRYRTSTQTNFSAHKYNRDSEALSSLYKERVRRFECRLLEGEIKRQRLSGEHQLALTIDAIGSKNLQTVIRELWPHR